MLLQYLIFAVFVTSQVSSGFFDYDYDDENEKFKLQEEQPPANSSNAYVTEQSLNYYNLNNDSEQQPYWLAYNQNGEANPSQIKKTNYPSYFASRRSHNHNKNEKVHVVYATSSNSQYSSFNNEEPEITNPDLLDSILSADSNAPRAKNAKNIKESKSSKEKTKQIYNLKNSYRNKHSEFSLIEEDSLKENKKEELNSSTSQSYSQEVANSPDLFTEDGDGFQQTVQDLSVTVSSPTDSSFTESTSEIATLGTTSYTVIEISTTPLPDLEFSDSDYDYLGNRNDQIYITNPPMLNDFTSGDQIQTTTMSTGFGMTSDILETTTPMETIVDEVNDSTSNEDTNSYQYDYSYFNDLINSSVDSVINYFKGSNTSKSSETTNTTSLEVNSRENLTHSVLDEKSAIPEDIAKLSDSEYDYDNYLYSETQNINLNDDSEVDAEDKLNDTKTDIVTGFVPKDTGIDFEEKSADSQSMKYNFKHKSDAKMKIKYEKLDTKFGKFKTNRIPFMLESGLKMVDEKVNENSTIVNETVANDNSTVMPFSGIHSYPLNSSFTENITIVDEILESTSIPSFKPLPGNETFEAKIPEIEEQIKGPFDEETENSNDPSPSESSRGFTYDTFIKQAQKSIYDKYDRKPKPFTKSDHSYKSYHRPIPKIRNEKDPELSFISAITNMGENIAHLSDKRKGMYKTLNKNEITESTTYHPKISIPLKNEPVESTTYHPKMSMTKKDEITESTTYHPNLIGNSPKAPDYSSVWKTKMLRRQDEESDDMTTTASSQSPEEVIESGLRRNDGVVYGDDSIGSAWIGLGEYFKTGPPKYHQASDLYDEEFIKTLIEDRSENVKDLEYVEDASEEEDWNEEEPKMKHASLNAHKGMYGERMAYDLASDRLLKKGKVIRSSSFFGQVPKMFKKQLKPKKTSVSGYIKNKVGQAESIDFGMPSLKFASRSDESMMMDFYNVIEKIGHELGQDVSGGYGMVGPRQSYDGVPGIVFLPTGTFSVRTKESNNRRSAKEQIIPIAVPQPVTVPVPQPIPVRILQPVAVTIPVPIPVERTIPIPVEKRIPVPVEKPVYVHVVKRIPVPVIKPYPVPVPVYKTQYILHDMPDPNMPPVPEFKGIPNDLVQPESINSNGFPHPELSHVQHIAQQRPIQTDSFAGHTHPESVRTKAQNTETVNTNTESKHTEQVYVNTSPKTPESVHENKEQRRPEPTPNNFAPTNQETVNGLKQPETYYVNNNQGYVPGYKINGPIHPELAHLSSGLIHPEAGPVNTELRHPEPPNIKTRPHPDALRVKPGTARPAIPPISPGQKPREPVRVSSKPRHPEPIHVHNVIHKHPESAKKHHPDHKRHPVHPHPKFKDVNNNNNPKFKEMPKDHKHYEQWSSVDAQGTHLRARQEVKRA